MFETIINQYKSIPNWQIGIEIIIFIFGLLVITATPVSEILTRITTSSKWLWSKRPERAERVEEEFEITDTPPFDTPVVGVWNEPEEEEEELDEEFAFLDTETDFDDPEKFK